MHKHRTPPETFDIFPSPVSVYSYSKHEEVKELIYRVISESNETLNSNSNALFHYGNDMGESILYNEGFENFKNWVEECCEDYVQKVLGNYLPDKMMVTDSWVNIANKGAFQYYHYHGNSIVSGTYYINFDEEHVPLFFKHPNTFEGQHLPVFEMEKGPTTKYNSDARINVYEGGLYLWRSHMPHGYPVNPKDDRISLSMNFIPNYISSGKYGFKATTISREEVQQMRDSISP